MNKLEQRIYDELPVGILDPKEKEEVARIAAEIALELAEKAYTEGVDWVYEMEMGRGYTDAKNFDQFKQEIL